VPVIVLIGLSLLIRGENMDIYQQEELMEKSFDITLMKRLMRFARPYWHWIVLSILLLLIITIGELLSPYLIKPAIDNHINITGRKYTIDGDTYSFFQYGRNSFLIPGEIPENSESIDVIESEGNYRVKINDEIWEMIPIPPDRLKELRQEDIDGLIRLSAIFLGVGIAIFVLSFFQSYLLQYTGQKIIYDMRQKIFSHLEKLSLSFFDNNPVGKLVTRVTNDTETLNEMYTNVLVNLFKDLFVLLGIIIVMLSIDAELALIVFTIIPFIFVLTIVFRINARKAHRRVRTLLSRMNAFLSEHIGGMRIIQIFHQQDRKSKEFDSINKSYYKAAFRETKIFAIFRPAIELLFAIALSLLIWFGGGKLIRGTLEFGVVFAFVNYIQMFFRPINDIAEKYNIMQSAMASAEKIFFLLDQDDMIKECENPVPMPEMKGKIEFRNVWFAYKKDEWVLKDVSFTINPGEVVAFVGATGAGKTSIINLINRFYDIQKGEILIDGIPIKRIAKKDLRRHIAIVLQDVFLFSGDIEYNIRLNNKNITRDKIVEVANYTNANKFIEKLPNQYNEKIMERGATLSTGQRQLLAFARALAFDPAILVLDEATSNIDTETEQLIQEALGNLVKGRTTIAIAHRLSTIQHADKIIVLHKGRIREMGNHNELLAKRGLYYRLYQLQYKSQEAV